MIQSFIHTSENDNLYIYDDQHRLSMLVHPEFRKAHEKSVDAESYYLKKHEYLREHGFFLKPKLADFGTLEESTVKENIINTKQIVFEVTDSCNLNCTYCGFGKLYEGFDERNQKNINIHNAINLLKYIFDLKHKNKKNKLNVGFYGGEPLLNIDFIKQIVEVVNQLKSEKEMDIDYFMTTNATLLHKYIDFIVANKFRMMVSLDGNEENHSYRFFGKDNKNSFQKVIENVDMIQKDYPEYFASHVSFNAVLHNRNSVKDIYEFIYLRYHKIPRISELNMRDIKPDNKDMLERMFHSMRKSEVEFQKEESDLLRITHSELSLYKELTDFLKYYSVNFYISNIASLLHDIEKYWPTNTCLPFQKKIFLTNRNKLLPCEKINYKYSMGNVNENENVMIDISGITRQFNFYYDHYKKICQNCYAYRFCGLCFFQIENLDKLGTEGFVCDNFYDQKDFKNKLHQIFSFLEKYPNDFFQILENVIIE